ncbi:MAG: dTMP kinase [Thermoplasmata archaeon]|nr:dTMP kinase [Thermoplasmata archaeon]
MNRRRGRLVVLEGIDGSGKSTLARALVRRWRARGRTVTRWHEPTDPGLGARAADVGASDPWTAAMLFTLDRAVARPELERLLKTSDVIADRSFYSTLAYQGSLLAPKGRRELERLERATAVPPDAVALLDLDAEEALARVGRRGSARSTFERRATLRRVARAYRTIARAERWPILDATLPPRALLDAADEALAPPPRRPPRRA